MLSIEEIELMIKEMNIGDSREFYVLDQLEKLGQLQAMKEEKYQWVEITTTSTLEQRGSDGELA